MKSNGSFLAAAALLAFTTPSIHALTVPVAEDASSTITNTITPATGKATTLPVNAKQTAFVRFDLSDPVVVPPAIVPGNISSATLRLYLSSTKPGDLTVHAVTTDWTEKPAGKSAPVPTVDTTVLGTIPSAEVLGKHFVTVDVTAAVKVALSAGGNDFGFAIQTASTTAKVLLGSKEGPGTGVAAELEIEADLANDGMGNITATTVTANLIGNVTGNVTGNATGTATSFTGSLAGDVSGGQSTTVVGTVGGVSAADLAAAAALANAAISTNTASALVRRDGSGNFAAGTITGSFVGDGAGLTNLPGAAVSGMVAIANGGTGASTATAALSNLGAASLTGANAFTNNMTITGATAGTTVLSLKGASGQTAALLDLRDSTDATVVSISNAGNIVANSFTGSFVGNVTGNTTGSAASFTGLLAGDVSGAQTATVVGTVGGVSAANVASGANLANAATDANTAGALVLRDASGNFSAGSITASLAGNAATATNAASFTGSLAGDVTGTQGATFISEITVTGKALTGFVSGAGSISATDSILTAIAKLDGNTGLKAPLASPAFTGTVLLPPGTATTAPFRLQTGVNLTTPVFGTVEFDGTNLFLTNNNASPTRKTVAFTDSTVTSAQIAPGAVTSTQLASGLTLGGTTTGSFSGPLAGNVTGNVSGSAASFTGSLAGDVTGTQGATVVSTVGTSSAANVHAAELRANAATNANTASTLVLRDASGNFSAGSITASLAGNAATATIAASFTGSLAGDVTGTQGATIVSTVGASTSANIHTAELRANAATSANTAGTLVLRDASGNFSAGTITIAGVFSLPATSSGSVGVITQNGTPLIHSAGTNSFFAGLSAGSVSSTASDNTAVGVNALTANTIAGQNVAIGRDALSTQSFANGGTAYGSNNVAVGYRALKANQPTATNNGSSNTAVGAFALGANTTGNLNTACGYGALSFNTTGNNNTACGYNSLSANSTGSSNTAFGFNALLANTTGTANTACGLQALLFNTLGSNNLACGNGALSGNTTAGQNVAIGVNALFTQSFSNSNTAWTSGNVAVGYQALRANQPTATSNGIDNTAVGWNALGANTTGTSNTATGFAALQSNTTAVANTAHGYNTLSSNTTGSGNLASGAQSLQLNSTGSNNTASGFNAMQNNTAGSFNTANGAAALQNNSTAQSNVAVGDSALLTQSFNNGGLGYASNNVAIGRQALKVNQPTATTNGVNNTALGSNALLANTTGANNIAIGNNAGNLLTTGNNNIDIGHVGVAGEDSIIRLGTPGVQAAAFVAAIRGTTTGINDAINVVIDSNGQLGTVSSSRRYKEDIADMGDTSARLAALRPVTFRYKKPYANGEKPIQFGLIAEEVAEVFPELAVFNAEGQPETVKYQDLAPLLLNEFLKDHRRADAKDAEIAALKQRLAELEAKDKERDARMTRLESLLPPAVATIRGH